MAVSDTIRRLTPRVSESRQGTPTEWMVSVPDRGELEVEKEMMPVRKIDRMKDENTMQLGTTICG